MCRKDFFYRSQYPWGGRNTKLTRSSRRGPQTTQLGSCPGAGSSSCCHRKCCNVSRASKPSCTSLGCQTPNWPGLGKAALIQGHLGGQESVWPLPLWWSEAILDTRLRSQRVHQSYQSWGTLSALRTLKVYGESQGRSCGREKASGELSEGQPGLGRLTERLGLSILWCRVDWSRV